MAQNQVPTPEYPVMLPVESSDDKLFAKQVEVLCDGMYDTLVLLFFERQREEGKRREEKQRVDGTASKEGGKGDEGIESIGW